MIHVIKCENGGMIKKSSVGAALKAIRKRIGMTQEELAAASGVSYRGLQDIERDIGNPTVQSLEALAKALKVPVGAFFEAVSSDNRKTSPSQDVPYRGTDPSDLSFDDAALILDTIRNATPVMRSVVLAILFRDPSLVRGNQNLSKIVRSLAIAR